MKYYDLNELLRRRDKLRQTLVNLDYTLLIEEGIVSADDAQSLREGNEQLLNDIETEIAERTGETASDSSTDRSIGQ